ncbi:4'-phosphopantetheinyl transferase family protein [Paenibacillus eucommiae]|uniref:4'-phosphopantetheinyl transferase n=1 Tax=Paenibacillus eucommiae TaxID=1355755 RepID=A0ABS4JC66_9BACL|nr:4'-phosphopantetheinyl transferase superfamily protein [Paenibacillus eucommiae]MBP1996329.1 4'-phosphopantetheinyl transferase [Paenibacillus eucommiae]
MNAFLYAVHLNSHVDFEQILHTLQWQEQQRISRYMRFQDKLNSLISTILIKFLLYKHFNVLSVMEKTVYGRPFVEDPLWHGDFNISHSGCVIVCALTHSGRIGVDIEKINDMDPAVTEQCLSEIELLQWNQKQSSLEKLKLFYRFWTLKESYLKYEGTGIAFVPLKNIAFEIQDEQASRLLQDKALKFCSYPFIGDYVISICSDKMDPPPKVNILQLNTLLSDYLEVFEWR